MTNENVGAFCGSVLLSENRWNKSKFLIDLQKDWGIEIPEEDTKDEETIITDINAYRIVISKFGSPIPNEEAEINARNNYLWPNAEEITSTHKAHILVAVFGDGNILEKAKLYTKFMATCSKQTNAIGVFTSGTVYEPNSYYDLSLGMKDDEFPLFNLVWFGLYKSEKGFSAYTYGLETFGKHEVEVLDVKDNPENLLDFISAIAAYIVEEDVEFHEFDTIGFSEDDIHEITLSEGIALEGQDTFKISYEGK